MKSALIVIFTLLLASLLAACSPQPEIIVVEITRLVSEIEEVEVTRIVEVEKEVTRIVEPPSAGSAMPGRDPLRVNELDFLQLEFWPDFDQPAVLVLLTGELLAGASLPLEIAIPIPEDAEINAVAQIEESGMTSIDFKTAPGAVVFESDTPAFRVEYYVPYQRDGDSRSYDFEWLAPFAVAELAVQIQKPANAVDLISSPEPTGVFTKPSDGLDYYLLDGQAAPAGIPYQLRFSYRMMSDDLTVDEPGSANPDLPGDPLHDQQAYDGRLVQNPTMELLKSY